MVSINNSRDRHRAEPQHLVSFDASGIERCNYILEPIFENAPHIASIKDAKTLRYMKVNRACETLFKKPRREIIGRLDDDFLGKDAAAIQANDRACLATGLVLEPIREKFRLNGNLHVLNLTRIPILDNFGKPQYLITLGHDVTAQATAELNIKRLQFLAKASAALNDTLDLDKILNQFGQVIVENMADWCIVDLFHEESRTVSRITAVARDHEMPSDIKNWWKTHTFDYGSSEGLGFVLRTGQSRVYRDVNVEKVRRWFPNDNDVAQSVSTWGIKSSAVIPLISHNRILGAISFISSTESQHYDEFDFSVIQELARRCSLAIENAQLFSKASEASRAKSAFLANISHEIRTPLGAIIGFSEILEADPTLAPTVKDHVQTVTRNAHQLMELVTKLLDFSEVEASTIKIKTRTFDLTSLLNDAVTFLRTKGEERGLEVIALGIGTEPRFVKTDPHRLRQILHQVLINALKFTPKGSITFRSRINKSMLEIDIEDSGIGLSAEQQLRIFQPFVQADGTTSRLYEGAGLGLFLARKMARLLGGDVESVWSCPSYGSLFRIFIKLEAPEEALGPSLTAPRLLNTPKRVLMVDDSADNRLLIEVYLAQNRDSIALDVAATGEEGVKMALDNNYDLILMDIQMPGMDGFASMAKLHENKYQGPVVALTAHSMRGDRERCLVAGFMDYLSKPVSRKALLDCLNRNLPGVIQ